MAALRALLRIWEEWKVYHAANVFNLKARNVTKRQVLD